MAGLAEVCSAPYPDATQFDPQALASMPRPRAENRAGCWSTMKLRRRTALLPAQTHARAAAVAEHAAAAAGNRLSITPVSRRPSGEAVLALLG